LALEVAVPIAILIGGFALRYIIVVAGQITAPAAL
jgi:formate-dependent nitrite reductase membrane component NrfD